MARVVDLENMSYIDSVDGLAQFGLFWRRVWVSSQDNPFELETHTTETTMISKSDSPQHGDRVSRRFSPGINGRDRVLAV